MCEQCGGEFYLQRNDAIRAAGRFCSVECKNVGITGVELVTATRYVRSRDGYVVIKTGIRKWELEHRLVMERVLGRKLATDEQVHHVNGIKADNDPSNLVVLSNAEHQRLHDHFNKHKR